MGNRQANRFARRRFGHTLSVEKNRVDSVFDYSQRVPRMFKRSLGVDPNAVLCAGLKSCPQILELLNGDFAVIGTDITVDATPNLPANAGCAPSERVVQIPRSLLIRARNDIPAVP